VGDASPPLQPDISVASAAAGAAWQTPAQNRRRETGVIMVGI
jgi:hypothetical protein